MELKIGPCHRHGPILVCGQAVDVKVPFIYAYVEKLSRKARLSDGFTGAEGAFFMDRLADRSSDRVTKSSGRMAEFLRRGVLPAFDNVSLCPEILGRLGIT